MGLLFLSGAFLHGGGFCPELFYLEGFMTGFFFVRLPFLRSWREKEHPSDVQLSETGVSRHSCRPNWVPPETPHTITALSYRGFLGGPLIGPPLSRERRYLSDSACNFFQSNYLWTEWGKSTRQKVQTKETFS